MSEPTSEPGFEGLGLKPELLSALAALGYEEPTPIQRSTMPPLLEGRDVIGQAATGTGKTAAFALPIVQRLTPGAAGQFGCSALVLVPTRELAIQVAEAVTKYGRPLGISVVPIYGGQEIGQQFRHLKKGVDVVVATPGRALDHLRRQSLKVDKARTVVLDEADEMLDLGFADDLEAILGALPDDCQTALFSATLPPRIVAISSKYLSNPVRVEIKSKVADPGELPKIVQTAYVVPHGKKDLALSRVLEAEAPERAIIFCRTRVEVDRLAGDLAAQGYGVAALHGGIDQDQRDRIIKRFKQQAVELLVATDVAARGLHIDNLSHVVNFDLPTSPEVYVHRIGRTGRAGAAGRALSLLESKELRLLKNVERLTRTTIPLGKLPTPADLLARRLGATRAAVSTVLSAGNLDRYRAVVDELATSAELSDVAAAAIAALHQHLSPAREGDEVELAEWKAPSAAARPARSRPAGEEVPAPRPSRKSPAPRASVKPPEPRASVKPPAPRASVKPPAPRASTAVPAPRPSLKAHAPAPPRPSRAAAAHAPSHRPSRESTAPARAPAAPSRASHGSEARARNALPASAAVGRNRSFTRLFVSIGKNAGVRPNDFVGAIANEAGLHSKEIGAIEIGERHSVVEVVDHRADQVIAALKATTIRGRPVKVSIDRNKTGAQRPR
ncbi:MAG: DEAD/DEAH box helicase [Myxococcaceae bacterium]|nr:DEAD/DEAH box helicase [Myxococcaceae bacterium]